ncbi:hypothetical protein A0H81_03225 [Grifola frondosa]|uniref:Proteophosphoglycan ppg4 n=1 Tax=Grifola frondosa TaxID=5627 RepID=A0A1C7MIF5_GRIFR|nr:hypothetical protein A0H81_03225 [Grifola frondosa]
MFSVWCPSLLRSLLLTILLSLSATAAPSVKSKRDGGGGSNLSAEIWVPLVVIGMLLVVGTVLACGGRKLRARIGKWGSGVAHATSAVANLTSQPRELTADQLAGSGGNTANNATNAGTNRSRRPRRTRRTPSQVSTVSLPVYMKEPGEHEIVIIRGLEDMEDDIPTTVIMPPVDESPNASFDIPRSTPEYVAMPNSANNMPLLQNEESQDSSPDPQHLIPPPRDLGLPTRASFDSFTSSEEQHSSFVPGLGEAPPYFEAVAMESTQSLNNGAEDAAQDSHVPSASSPEPDTPERSPSGRRRSNFLSLFNPRHSRSTASPVPTVDLSGHTRESSGSSLATSGEGLPRSGQHRPSHSGSGSVFSLSSSAFRNMSRTRSRSNHNLAQFTSPSAISLNSISAPLTHTLIRTDFTYPKSGPTPEQLRLISSRESFARFGVPYGRDAIAYASASRVDLAHPPPGFDDISGPSEPHVEGESAAAPEHPTEADVSAEAPAPRVETPEGGAQAIVSPTESTSHDAPAASITSNNNGSPVPPSSFKPLSPTSPDRVQSRASSYASFATAEEALDSSPSTPGPPDIIHSPTTPATPVSESTPSTPRLSSRHIHEETEMTITPSSAPVALMPVEQVAEGH